MSVVLGSAQAQGPGDLGQRPPTGSAVLDDDAAAPPSDPHFDGSPTQARSVPAIAVRPATLTSPKAIDAPERISVPSLNIDAAVNPTGVRTDGTAVIPDDVRTVGWYRFGPTAGSRHGSTVIVGHVDSRTQGRGALYPLRNVAVGARVYVAMPGRATVAYRVVSREFIDKGRMPWDDLFARTGGPRLTVITCGGPYDAAHGGYQDNLVVTAVPLEHGSAP